VTAVNVDAAVADRSLVVTWLMRNTLHLVRSEDYPWLLGLTARIGEKQGARRLGEEGVPHDDAERAVATIVRALADGPLLRAELAEHVTASGVRSEGQAMPHLLALAARRGLIVRGPIRGGDQAFALTGDWLGMDPPESLEGEERQETLRELARRYLRGHDPAGPEDLAAWSGLGLRDCRAAFETISSGTLGSDPKGSEPVPPRLLGAFDPYLLGWKDRGFAVPAEHAKKVHPGGGMLRPVVTVDGLAVGTWRRQRGEVEIEPFGELDADLDGEIEDIGRFER
jgi:hypothetical protein